MTKSFIAYALILSLVAIVLLYQINPKPDMKQVHQTICKSVKENV